MEETLRRDLASLSASLHARGWVANHDGNVSARLGEDRFLATPTALSKRVITPEMAIVVDTQGNVVSGSRKVFSEFALHRAVYAARPDVGWVVHAHPPVATGWAVAGEPFFDPPFLAEPVVSLGRAIPLVPFLAPGADLGPLTVWLGEVDAVLLGNHGVLTVGPDAETALLRMELVEHLAKIALTARQVGGARPLPDSVVEQLLASRRKAGLGPRPDAPAPAASGGSTDVEALVRDALRRLG